MKNVKLEIVKEATILFEDRVKLIENGKADPDDVSLFLCDCISSAIGEVTGKEVEYHPTFRNDHLPEFVELAKSEGVYRGNYAQWWEDNDLYARRNFLAKLKELVNNED